MADDSTTTATESPWSAPLKALIGSATFSGLHPDGQAKAVAQVASAYNPNWSKATDSQRNAFVQGALAKYGQAGPSADKAAKPGFLGQVVKDIETPQFSPKDLKDFQAGKPEAFTGANDPLVQKATQIGMASGIDFGAGGNLQESYGVKSILQPAWNLLGRGVGAIGDVLTGRRALGEATTKIGDEAEEAQNKYIEEQLKIDNEAGENLAKKVEAAKESAVRDAKQQALENVSGRSQSQTIAQRAPEPEMLSDGTPLPSPEHLDYLQKATKHTLDPINRSEKPIQEGYEKLVAEHGKEQLAGDDVREYLKAETKSGFPKHFSGQAKDVYDKAVDLLFPKGAKESVPTGQMTEEEINELASKAEGKAKPKSFNTPAIRDNNTGKIYSNPQGHGMAFEDFEKQVQGNTNFESGFVRDGKFLTKDEALKATEMDSAPVAKKVPVKEATFRQLHDLRSQAAKMASASRPMSPERNFFSGLVKSLDKQAEDHGIEGIGELNQNWRFFHNHFEDVKNAVIGGADPATELKTLFKDPNGFNFLISGANNEEKSFYRELFPDFVNSQGGAEKFFNSPQAKYLQPALKKLYPNSIFDSPDGWIFSKHVLDHFDQVAKDVPQVQANFTLGRQQAFKEMADKYAQDTTKAALKAIEKLPRNQAEAMTAAINKVTDPVQQSKLASKMAYGLDMDQVMASALKTSQIEIPNKLKNIPGVPEYLRNKWALLGAALMFSSGSGYMKGMEMAGGVMGVQSLLTKGLQAALANGTLDADHFVANLGKPMEAKGVVDAGKWAAKGLMTQFIRANNMKDAGPPEDQPKPKVDVPKTKAENITMRATGGTKLADLSKAPIEASMDAYAKAVHEDNDAESAKEIRSIITAKLGGDLQGLNPKVRTQLATMLKDEPELDNLDRERTEARGTV